MTYMTDTRRGTGKTFRNLLKALMLTSEGKRVIYITNSEHEAYNLWQYALKVCESYGIELRTRRFSIEFTKSGRLDFLSNALYLAKLEFGDFKGIHGVTAVRDVR